MSVAYDYDYDRYLRPVAIIDRRGNTTSMAYDSAGRMLTRQAPMAFGYGESRTYDDDGRQEAGPPVALAPLSARGS
jgi:YD repeat-containing protein